MGGCALVPAVDQASTCPSFRNRHSLLLATGNTANPSIPNEGLPHVTKTENGGENVGDGFDVVVPALAVRS